MNSTLALPETRLRVGRSAQGVRRSVPLAQRASCLASPCLLHTAAALKDALASFISIQLCCIVISRMQNFQ